MVRPSRWAYHQRWESRSAHRLFLFCLGTVPIIGIIPFFTFKGAAAGRAIVITRVILALTGFLLVDLAHDAEIMFRMLEIILRSDTVARGLGIARQGLVLVVNLEGIATDAHIRAVAVVILVTLRSALAAVATIIVAAVAIGIAATTTTTAAAIITAAAA